MIVLSNNDGCAVARTNEAKALWIKMGQPYFQIRQLCERDCVVALSSNYALYGDMSRGMNTLYERFSPEIEIYSIDESFLDVTPLPPDEALLGTIISRTRRSDLLPLAMFQSVPEAPIR